MWYLKCLLMEGSQLDICMLVTYVTLSVICKKNWSDRPQTRVTFPFGWPKIGKYLGEKVVLLLYFFWLVILFELCVVWVHLIRKRMEFLDMCILLTLNAAYCPLEHMEVRWHLCKIHWNGCDFIFPTWVCLHADCEKSSRSTGVVLLSVYRP